MYKKFVFKGLELEQGDTVAMIADSFPFEFQAAVVNYDEVTDTLEVMSTQLVITRHSGKFSSSDVKVIEVVRKYDEAVPLEARADLHRGQLCIVYEQWKAIVTAAIDGVVTGQIIDTPGVEDGKSVTGGSSFWQAA